MQAGGSDQWDDSYPNRDIITADIEQGTLFVCIDNEAIAGIIVLDENQSEQYGAIEWQQQQGPHLVMHRLAVHPEFQGKGIARQLIAFAEEYARRSGYSSIRMDTYAKNERVLKIYPSLGYVQRGEIYFPGRTAAFPVFEKILKGISE
ncbi:hypothetical protein KC345_g11442 [Hortaea werneckii]|nr:hypothetical protein KC345_g11442 [Hortaea werneckii]